MLLYFILNTLFKILIWSRESLFFCPHTKIIISSITINTSMKIIYLFLGEEYTNPNNQLIGEHT